MKEVLEKDLEMKKDKEIEENNTAIENESSDEINDENSGENNEEKKFKPTVSPFEEAIKNEKLKYIVDDLQILRNYYSHMMDDGRINIKIYFKAVAVFSEKYALVNGEIKELCSRPLNTKQLYKIAELIYKYRLIPANKEDVNDEYHSFDENMDISSL